MKTFDLRPTSDPNLFRVVDRQGEWEHYAYVQDPDNFDPRDGLVCRFLRGVTAILHRAWGKPQLMTWAKHQLPGVVEQKLHYGGEKGDAVHQFIAKVLSGEECSKEVTPVVAEDRKTERSLRNDEWDCVLSFTRFWEDHQPKLIAFERAVANLRHGYGGSLDAIVRLTRACGLKSGQWKCGCASMIGRLLLLDWKSGGGIYDDMGAQVAAYANADLSQILHDHRLGGTAIVRLGTKRKTTGGYDVEFYSGAQTRIHFVEFKAAIRIDDACYKPFDPSSIFEIPESVSVTIEREDLSPKQDNAAA